MRLSNFPVEAGGVATYLTQQYVGETARRCQDWRQQQAISSTMVWVFWRTFCV